MAALTHEQVDIIRSHLRAAPEIEPASRMLSKQEAVRRLEKQIRAAQKRGYTIRQLAEFLTKNGVPFTEGHLSNCLWRASRVKGASSIVAPARRETQPPRAPPAGNGRFQIRPDNPDI